MEEIDFPYRPYIRAMHPNLAMIEPNIIRAIPPMILRRVLIGKSNIGMVEGQLVHILLRQALIGGQGFKARLFTGKGCILGALVLPKPNHENVGS